MYDLTHSLQGVTGIYQEQGYYYALGLGTGGRTEMTYGPLGMEAFIRYHYFSGIQGIDRMQSRVTHDLDFEDQRLWMQLTLSYALVDHLKLALDAGKVYRWSDIRHLQLQHGRNQVLRQGRLRILIQIPPSRFMFASLRAFFVRPFPDCDIF